ncbi:MAG TPA: hypothetical protein VE999_09310 [Gemmataceae bacterium]|nr:hypothetical protein [Gemmataceae bacterium]
MVQTCGKCSRANPAEAVFCYFDGFALGSRSRNGGPVAVGVQAFAYPFVFPSGRSCRSFNELALACQDEWEAARDLLRRGHMENFFSRLGRADLASAAKAAANFPDADLGLDQLLEKLPTDVLDEPHLSLETREINLGVLEVGVVRQFQLHMENQGMRLISGTVTAVDAPWLSLGEGASNEKHFHFQHELKIPLHVRGDKLRANNNPLEGHLEVESNGGSFIVAVRAQVPVKPFPSGVLTGARSPRQVAEKAKANSKEAAVLFENGVVAEWYKSNGWTYPVQGPAASGLGAIQQFYEALGLTAPPKVEISTNRIDLSGTPGEQLRCTIEVKSQEKRPVYAHAVSNQPWLEVSRARLSGRVAAIHLTVPSVPDKEGETLNAKLIVQSNGNQRFLVPVTLQIGGNFFFGDAGERGRVSAPREEALGALTQPRSPGDVGALTQPRSPVVVVPSTIVAKRSGAHRRNAVKQTPFWVHLIPAALLLAAVLLAVVIDRSLPPPAGTVNKDEDIRHPADDWKYDVKDPEPHINVRFDPEKERFGLEMTQQKDPDNPDKFKRLTYDEHGRSNNTVIKIDGFEYKFGNVTPSNVWGGSRGRLKQVPITSGGRRGWESTMEFTNEKVEVLQHVEIVPGQSGYLDTVLVYYTLRNKDEGKHKIGIRVMIDTFIGANDGVPFTIPGKKGFVDTKAEYTRKDIPDYIEVIENPNDPNNAGTVARMGLSHLRLPGIDLEDMERLRICRFPGTNAGWDDWRVEPMRADDRNDKGDSCVVMYWPYETMNPGETRYVAFTYGLGSVEIGGSNLALSVPSSVQPDSEFVVTAYVWNAKKGDKVTLTVPAGLKLAGGESEEKIIEEGGGRSQVFWRLRSGGSGEYTLEAATEKAKAKSKKVIVKATSIFG